MANKLNSMPDFTARIPKTPHDLSQSFGFTTCPGQILPLYFDMLHHGDEIHFSASEFVRLNPIEKPALGEIELHLDHFFVPLPVMYTPSSSMFYQTDDLISGLFKQGSLSPQNFPVFDFNHPLTTTVTQSFFDYFDRDKANSCAATDDGTIRLNLNFFDCVGKSVLRMFDALRMNPIALLNAAPQYDVRTNYPRFTPWFALAYQAIYQLSPLFRNTDREPKNYHYNIDRYFDQGQFSETTFGKKSIFNINYCQKHRDYFTSVKVSPMGSNVSMLCNPSDVFRSVNDWLNQNVISVSNNLGNFNAFDSESTQTSSNQSSFGAPRINSNSIRQLFMVDKLLRIIGRTEKNYESQFLAHYGIKVPHDDIHNITHIGHDVAVLRPDSVISSADTYNGETGAALGEIGGQGSKMLTGRKYNFKAPFVGVFMTVGYVKPRVRYVAGLDKLHMFNQVLDFWQPEFDKKGMEPLFQFEFDSTAVGSGSTFAVRKGWQFAYEKMKRRYDVVSLAFTPTTFRESVNAYSPWFLVDSPFGHIDYQGVLQHPAPSDSLDFTNFFVSPTSLNGVMQVMYDTRWVDIGSGLNAKPWLLFQTDPLICDFNMYIKKVNGMSTTGEPELDC